MKPAFVIVLLSLGLLLPACGKAGPCSGGGMAVDQRELPADWKAAMPVPAGAVACHQADGGLDAEYSRSYELGDSPQAGFDAFRKHLAANGWKTTSEDVADDTFLRWEGDKDGATLKLQVSRKVEDKGWASLDFRPAKK